MSVEVVLGRVTGQTAAAAFDVAFLSDRVRYGEVKLCSMDFVR